jgi:hypothetical protein
MVSSIGASGAGTAYMPSARPAQAQPAAQPREDADQEVRTIKTDGIFGTWTNASGEWAPDQEIWKPGPGGVGWVIALSREELIERGLMREATPEEKAELAAAQAANPMPAADYDEWMKQVSSFKSNTVYFRDVAVMDLNTARSEAGIVKLFMENGTLDDRHVNAFNGDQRTSSIQEYLSWIYQRIEALDPIV